MLKSSVQKAWIALLHDSIMAGLSFLLSLYLRLGDNFVQSDPYRMQGLLIFTLSSIAIFIGFKLYRRSWRYISTQDLIVIVQAVTLAVLVFLPLMFMVNRLENVPRSLMVINWFVLLALLGGPRFIYRMLQEHTLSVIRVPEHKKIAVLMIGANDYTEQFLRETVDNRHSDYRIVGILDNDNSKRGQYIRNVKVYGEVASLGKVVTKLQQKGRAVQKIIITPDLLDGTEISQIMDIAEAYGLTVSRLPRLTDFRQTETRHIPLRPIMLEDLLGRPQKALDRERMSKLIKGKRVLVTGAGGTIGSELVRQIAGYKPSHITLLDNSEYNLYSIDMELLQQYPELSREAVLADVRDKGNLERIFKEANPAIVCHAAALKHVPMSEFNCSEAVLTNVIGTRHVADVCVKAHVEVMVMVSTDKAVNPTNVMGASKRLAESYVQALGASRKSGKTRFVTIRFGNVLGSTGSVIPLFKQQIEKGGPVTVTHPKITRYFMTVREAVELILQSTTMAWELPAEESHIYVLDMGEPVLINDLAEQLIRLAGLIPHKDIHIDYVGLRPGEKLFEELFYGEEDPVLTDFEGILLAKTREISVSEISKQLKKLEACAVKREDASLVVLMQEVLPEYDTETEEYKERKVG